jgi:hypothetical protein
MFLRVPLSKLALDKGDYYSSIAITFFGNVNKIKIDKIKNNKAATFNTERCD